MHSEVESITWKNKKRLFQTLDEMNISDVENNITNIAVCPNLVSAEYSPKLKGTKITMGASGNVVFDLQTDKIIPVLLLVNRDEYERLGKTISHNVQVLCVCGGIVALTVGIALKLNRITAVEFSTSTAITQNTCYAQCF